jgi:hypothetical protein
LNLGGEGGVFRYALLGEHDYHVFGLVQFHGLGEFAFSPGELGLARVGVAGWSVFAKELEAALVLNLLGPVLRGEQSVWQGGAKGGVLNLELVGPALVVLEVPQHRSLQVAAD